MTQSSGSRRTFISRSAAYAALTIALVATFGGTEAFIQNIGQDYLGMNVGGVSGGMAAAVAAVMLNPLHERVTSWAEKSLSARPGAAQARDAPAARSLEEDRVDGGFAP